ncbi:MAG: MBL fold metallo-hydrolase [Bryobacteraceae bacterium]|nr:MBL fold metallo-hydrolase [Bryobacteraceae bacterium]
MKLTLWGAVQTVTGSMHHLAVGGRRYLLDCGLYQGRRAEARDRNTTFPFAPRDIDAVLVSHAHIDHTGNLPTLVKQGFEGPICATRATVDLCGAMLPDSAHIQEKDAEFVNKRHYRRRRIDATVEAEAVEPLYTAEDVERTLPMLREIAYRLPRDVDDSLVFEAYDAGHTLGSAALVLERRRNGGTVRLAFSGDVGRPGLPIIRDPEPLPPVDYLIMESTYGDRLHKTDELVSAKLARVVNRTANRGGKLIVPAFAVGRTQQLVMMLHQLIERRQIPSIPMFVDSPLAVNVTEVFRRHSECYDEEAARYLWDGDDPFGFGRLRYVRDVAESKALNDLKGPFIVISASGMCESGRILHHLRNNIEDPRNTVLITGFQAQNTLGRKLVDRPAEVAIFGLPMRVRAEIETLNELSAHGDQRDLLRWIKPMTPTLKRIFLVHGEPLQSRALAAAIHETYGIEAVIPSRGDEFELS